MISEIIKKNVREIQDFPKPGINFIDITPLLANASLVKKTLDAFINQIGDDIDVICAVESRGFYWGLLIAQELNIPFVPVRKKGKLPGDTIAHSYDLEYGSSTIEIQRGTLQAGQRVHIHDDLLATGGTVHAVAHLLQSQKVHIQGFSFLISLNFLSGAEKIKPFSKNIISLAEYN
ncbi:MAG: adenine phosphoribosyltransferase [Chitinophagaceae bacterium]|nr:MAG: adenine phosphoribosyltransferase [Chitinophagaceae bacterium]